MLKIKTWRDPYDAGFSPTKPTEIEFKPGLTVLVGCNGAGKSTLLMNIKDECKSKQIPLLTYNNLTDGGSSNFGEYIYSRQYEKLAYLSQASEGECIKYHIGDLAENISHFIHTGKKSKKKSLVDSIEEVSYGKEKINERDKKLAETKERVLLFDAVDSGLSVDAIVEVKSLFDLIMEDNKDSGKDIYIIISANEYELARNVDCFDVNAGKYIRFKDYEDYRAFILKSRTKKEKRYIQQQKFAEKKEEKKRKRIEFLKEKISKFKSKENLPNRDRWKLDDYERELRELER